MNKYKHNNEEEIVSCLSSLLKRADELRPFTIQPDEQAIFDILMAANKESGTNATLRIAGGFVRDRLLGKISKDIDIAIDKVSGEQFANVVRDYMIANGHETKSVGVIKSNPDQSKHLETATTFINGLPIDFVNLRTETYTDSRVPTIAFGTPEEDAMRRDLTINALFYNINTGQIEDFTGKGLEDLKNGVIRTPLDPKQTFMDDPLRVLRAIRFSSKLGFQLDPNMIEAAKSPEVKDMLLNKISKERIADELRKMLQGKDPAGALRLIQALDLREEVFNRPAGIEGFDMEQNNPHHEMVIWDHLVKVVDTLNNILNTTYTAGQENKVIMLLAALLHDVGKLDPTIRGTKELEGKLISTYHGHEKSSQDIARHMMKQLMMSTDEIDGVLKLIEGAGRVEDAQRQEAITDKQLRRLVFTLGERWRDAVYLAAADDSSKLKDGIDQNKLLRYDDLVKKIEKATEFQDTAKLKPIINGNDIAQLLGVRPGPQIGNATKQLIDWQLENPTGTKEQATQWLLENKDSLVGFELPKRDKPTKRADRAVLLEKIMK